MTITRSRKPSRSAYAPLLTREFHDLKPIDTDMKALQTHFAKQDLATMPRKPSSRQ